MVMAEISMDIDPEKPQENIYMEPAYEQPGF
jgi:hypothetical protein